MQLMLRKWPALHQLAFSIALAVLAGYLPVDGSWLSLSRTFVYLPFFIAGYHFSFERMERLLTRKVRLAAIALSLAWFGLIALGGADIAPGWLYGSMTYGQLGHPEWYAGVFRLLLYPLQLFAGIVFWGFVPAKRAKSPRWDAIPSTYSCCTDLSSAWLRFPRFMPPCGACLPPSASWPEPWR